MKSHNDTDTQSKKLTKNMCSGQRETVELVTDDEDNIEDLSAHQRKLRWIRQLGGQKLVNCFRQQERQRSFITRPNRTPEQKRRDNAKAKTRNERYRKKLECRKKPFKIMTVQRHRLCNRYTVQKRNIPSINPL